MPYIKHDMKVRNWENVEFRYQQVQKAISRLSISLPRGLIGKGSHFYNMQLDTDKLGKQLSKMKHEGLQKLRDEYRNVVNTQSKDTVEKRTSEALDVLESKGNVVDYIKLREKYADYIKNRRNLESEMSTYINRVIFKTKMEFKDEQ